MEQLNLFGQFEPAADAQKNVSWNLWHGCHKISPGCQHCYVYRSDARFGRDSSLVKKTADFDLPIRRDRQGIYKLPSGSTVYTCFTSDFFLEDADPWRPAAWEMIRSRPDLSFFFITKRIHRFWDCVPADWGEGYPNMSIGCTVENQAMAQRRLPLFHELPIREKSIICEPLLEPVDLSPWLDQNIHLVLAGGESGADVRPCDFDWVLDLRRQCIQAQVAFSFKQTGAYFRKGGVLYHVPRKFQHSQAKKASINYIPQRKDLNTMEVLKIALEGVLNTRDLGGYPTVGGGKTQPGQFLRTADVTDLTSNDLETLRRMGLTLSVDLRSRMEVQAMPSPLANIPNVKYENIYLLDQFHAEGPKMPASLGELYCGLLQNDTDAFERMFRLFASQEGLCQFHCTAGKDRTGVTAMLLLDLAGVPEETIVEDYILSEAMAQSLISKQKSTAISHGAVIPEFFLHAKASDMEEAIRFLRENWNNAEGYLLACGLTAEEITALRRKLTGKPQ